MPNAEQARLGGHCSVQYQLGTDPNGERNTNTSTCRTGYDPHVHPYLFINGTSNGVFWFEEIPPVDEGHVFGVRVHGTRANLALDAVVTDLGEVVFNTRKGVNATTLESLDDLLHITPWLTLMPGRFRSFTPADIYYDLHFYQRPNFLEVRDIWGKGVRWEAECEV